MGLVVAKAFLLSLFTVSCFFTAVFGEETESLAPHYHGRYLHPAKAPSHPPSHHHHPPSPAPSHPLNHAPVHIPMQPPAHAPAHPPIQPPVHTPVHPSSYHFPRSFVAVQGVVYCKSCKYAGVDTLLGASPVSGATVKLQCNNTRYPIVVQAKTDKNGYFLLQAPKSITNYGAHKCKASLVSAPSTACSKITDLHGGLNGAILRPEKSSVANKLLFVLYSVGPFAFEV